MSVAIGVVAHTARSEQAHTLQEGVKAVYMSVDNGYLGATRNHRKVWSWLRDHADADHLVVLEDDAEPIPSFNTQLEAALAKAPAPIVGLYLGTGYPPQWQTRIRQTTLQADNTNACWILGKLLYGVGVAIRSDLIADMLEVTEHSRLGFDFAIRDWATHRQHRIAFTWPSLLDHRDDDTLTRHPDGAPRALPRKAHKTGGHTTWTGRKVTL